MCWTKSNVVITCSQDPGVLYAMYNDQPKKAFTDVYKTNWDADNGLRGHTKGQWFF